MRKHTWKWLLFVEWVGSFKFERGKWKEVHIDILGSMKVEICRVFFPCDSFKVCCHGIISAFGVIMLLCCKIFRILLQSAFQQWKLDSKGQYKATGHKGECCCNRILELSDVYPGVTAASWKYQGCTKVGPFISFGRSTKILLDRSGKGGSGFTRLKGKHIIPISIHYFCRWATDLAVYIFNSNLLLRQEVWM